MTIIGSIQKRNGETDHADRRIYEMCSLALQNGITSEQARYLLKRSEAQGAPR